MYRLDSLPIVATLPTDNSATDSRRRLGQVFTPPAVADWMAAWACEHSPRRILEPSVGEGVFLKSIAAQASKRLEWHPRIFAHEIDERLRGRLREAPRELALSLSGMDFILSNDRRRYDACLANPPYVRHHTLKYDAQTYRRFDEQVGERISRMTNLYGLFLLRIWERLGADGRAAVIMPSEWLNADFGRPLKRFLLRENAIDAVVLFADDALVFDDALTTAAILLLRRDRSVGDAVRTAIVRDSASLSTLRFDDMRRADAAALDPVKKWTNTLADVSGAIREDETSSTLGDIASCMRGIATGANDYFTLTESERLDAGIDIRDVTPCITKANHATTTFGADQFEQLRQEGRKCWLLDPETPLAESVVAYLERGRTMGIDARYLPSHRPVWYRPEKRKAAPIWAPVFVRGRFRFIRNDAGALNLTAFHGVYPRRNDAGAIDMLLQYLLSDAAQRAIGAQSRLYGGGLRKLEPRDVLAIPIPESLQRAVGDY